MVEKTEIPLLVSGFRLALSRQLLIFTILKLAYRFTGNPLKAYSLLRKLAKERLATQGNSGKVKAVKSGGRYYWTINVPGWPSEAFNKFIINELQRIKSPEKSNLQTIIFSITNLCPLHCDHCYEWDNISSTNTLSSSDLKMVMDKIKTHGINHVQLSGGEPLSRFDDMIDLMRYSGNACDYWINTSGFGLTEEKARIMKQNGMTGAVISLDDWDETRHNTFRHNNKSFHWVKEACRNCNDAGIIVCLSICPVKEFVTTENLNKYFDLAKELGAGFIRVIEPRKAGKYSGMDVMLDSRQIGIIDKFMISRNGNPAYSEYPIIQFPGHHQRSMGCIGAGNRFLYIDSNGVFHACPFCRGSLGNALTDSLESGILKARAGGCHVFKQKTLI